MHRNALAQLLFPATTAIAALLLAACGGGGGPSAVVGGSSSGGSTAVLAGTFVTGQGSTNAGAPVFGAVNSDGNGFFAAFSGTPSIFSFQSASSNGAIIGVSFAAYAANGSEFGNGTTLDQGDFTGTVTTQSTGVTVASLSFTNETTPPSFTDSASITLDHPVLVKAPLSTAAGTYEASYGSVTAISSPGLSNSTSATYTVALDADGTLAMTSDGGCVFGSGSATVDITYNIYTLSIPATCNGDTAPVTLNGLAVYLPAGAVINGATLTSATLLLELDDALSKSGAPKRALALAAARQ